MVKFPSFNLGDLPKKYLYIGIGLSCFVLLAIWFFQPLSFKDKNFNYSRHISQKTPEIEKAIYLEGISAGVDVLYVEVDQGGVRLDIMVEESLLSNINVDIATMLFLSTEKYGDLKHITIRASRFTRNRKNSNEIVCVVFADIEDISKVKISGVLPEEVDIVKNFETWLHPSLI